MLGIFNFIKKLITYDSDRDFYAKYYPKLAENMDLMSFRPMSRSDLKLILDIERQVYDFPWSARTFTDCMKIGYLCWVCERIDEVVAYGILSVAAGESHVMNICVSPKYHRQGIGRRMMNKLVDVAIENRAETILLEVRPSNDPALGMYADMGFNEIGMRKNYYPADGGREDAIMLAMELPAGKQKLIQEA